ncbi:MarR family transcriptional regulator [Streptomyces sp. PLK6-54]|uniref:MarR family transcriptional regulator n=1 Tax=Actinacidiphila acidipaludis TaxID=2873382 RepID=A0ABS7Q204_9ACTN|nr:MarR family transcriptional regulator [Streptomyces acidipaludis]
MSNPPESSTDLLERLQHQVALFARRAEQTRLGGVGKARNSMDRAAYLLLNRLDREGPMGVKALAEAMGIDSSTVTRQVAPLVDTGLVKRTSHPEDGRAVVLALSPRGRGRLEEVRDSRRRLMSEVTEDWTAQEREVFTDLLVRFNTALAEWHAGLGQRDESDDGAPGAPAALDVSPADRTATVPGTAGAPGAPASAVAPEPAGTGVAAVVPGDSQGG